MIMIIIQLLKLMIDTVIRGYTLHSIYGWSIHLLGALFASITALLVHIGSPEEREPNAETEMRNITYSQIPVVIETKPEDSGSYPTIRSNIQQLPQNPSFLSL